MAISEVQQVLIPWAPSFIFMERAGPLHIFHLHLSDGRKRAWNTSPQLFSSLVFYFFFFLFSLFCEGVKKEMWGWVSQNYLEVLNSWTPGTIQMWRESEFLPSLVSGWWSAELTAASKSCENTFFRLCMGFWVLVFVLNSLFRSLGHSVALF